MIQKRRGSNYQVFLTDKGSRSLKRNSTYRKSPNQLKESFFTCGITPQQLYYNTGQESKENISEDITDQTQTEILDALNQFTDFYHSQAQQNLQQKTDNQSITYHDLTKLPRLKSIQDSQIIVSKLNPSSIHTKTSVPKVQPSLLLNHISRVSQYLLPLAKETLPLGLAPNEQEKKSQSRRGLNAVFAKGISYHLLKSNSTPLIPTHVQQKTVQSQINSKQTTVLLSRQAPISQEPYKSVESLQISNRQQIDQKVWSAKQLNEQSRSSQKIVLSQVQVKIDTPSKNCNKQEVKTNLLLNSDLKGIVTRSRIDKLYDRKFRQI